jgi:hypothetical protein
MYMCIFVADTISQFSNFYFMWASQIVSLGSRVTTRTSCRLHGLFLILDGSSIFPFCHHIHVDTGATSNILITEYH